MRDADISAEQLQNCYDPAISLPNSAGFLADHRLTVLQPNASWNAAEFCTAPFTASAQANADR